MTQSGLSCKTSQNFQQRGYLYRLADTDDEAALRYILAHTAMAGWVKLSLQRESGFFKACKLMGDTQVVIAHKDNSRQELVGMYTMTVMPVHINEQAMHFGYLGSLRVLPTSRNKIRVLQGGFASIAALTGQRGCSRCWFTSIATDNLPARRILEAGIRHMPQYRRIGEIETLALSTQQARAGNLLQAATSEDIPELVDFYNQQAASYQFSPVLSQTWLKNLKRETNALELHDFLLFKQQGKICACVAIWDQRTMKQTIIHGYKRSIAMFRPLYNLAAKMTGRVALPAPGYSLEQVYLAFFAVTPEADDFAIDIIREALAVSRSYGADVAVLGLSINNRLLPMISAALPAIKYNTCIQAVAWHCRNFEMLDFQYHAQPEIALL